MYYGIMQGKVSVQYVACRLLIPVGYNLTALNNELIINNEGHASPTQTFKSQEA